MLTKAILFQKGHPVFDDKAGMSIGLESALKLCLNHQYLTAPQVGAIRAVDNMRDAAQHWMIVVPEDVLYLHARAIITVIDEVLIDQFSDTLADNLPLRVLPVSTLPICDVQTLIGREYEQIAALLAPGKRARDEARGRIRTLLALESHVADNVALSERDIDRIEAAVRANAPQSRVFPRLATLRADAQGSGVTVKVKFGRADSLPAVRYIAADDPTSAAAIREVDLQSKYHLSPQDLARLLELTVPKAKALRAHYGVDSVPSYAHCFRFGTQDLLRFSDNAVRALRPVCTSENVALIWEQSRGRGANRPPLPLIPTLSIR